MNSKRNKTPYSVFIIILLFFSVACRDEFSDLTESTVTDSFESGSIGLVTHDGAGKWELHLTNDNKNPDLPNAWRSWWYVRMDKLSTARFTEITIRNEGWPFYYLPVYSYDQKEWFRFTENEVTQEDSGSSALKPGALTIRKQFAHSTVWIARFYPYTFSDLEKYLAGIAGSPHIRITIPGHSQEGRPVYLLKITDFSVPPSAKKRVFMHARTHPAETPPSFLLEGMIGFLNSGVPAALDLLAKHEFYIFPMHNVDGVIAGNYRSTPRSENLEVMWFFDPGNPLDLTSEAPPEVKTVHRVARELMTDGGPPVSIALNLHASNSEPDIRPFFFPHFGPADHDYGENEAALWWNQLSFIEKLAYHTGPGMLEPVQNAGGSAFLKYYYPETWWWANFKDQVMAITFEMTYGRGGHAPRWIGPGDMRKTGEYLALAIGEYSGQEMVSRSMHPILKSTSRKIELKYPDLYPARSEYESKK
jgi:hypothetical protein